MVLWGSRGERSGGAMDVRPLYGWLVYVVLLRIASGGLVGPLHYELRPEASAPDSISVVNTTASLSSEGDVDVYIMPATYATGRVSDETPREYLPWHLLARAFGIIIGPVGICTEPQTARIAFARALTRRKVFFTPIASARSAKVAYRL